MEISSSSSDEDYYFDEPFNSIFNRVFKKNELISDNSEDNCISENNINTLKDVLIPSFLIKIDKFFYE